MASLLILVRVVVTGNLRTLVQSSASTKSNFLVFAVAAALWIWYGSRAALALDPEAFAELRTPLISTAAQIVLSFLIVPFFAFDPSPALVQRMYLPVSRFGFFTVRTLTLHCSPIGLTVLVPAFVFCVVLVRETTTPLLLWTSVGLIVCSHYVSLMIHDLLAVIGVALTSISVAAVVPTIYFATGTAFSDTLSSVQTLFSPEPLLGSVRVVAFVALAAACAAMGSFLMFEIRFSQVRRWQLGFECRAFSCQGPTGIAVLTLDAIRSFRRMVDPYIGLALAIAYVYYLLTAVKPSPDAMFVIIMIVLLSDVSVAMNSFGMETSRSLERYSISPITGRQLLMTKHAAYITICSIQLLPVLGAIAVTFGTYETSVAAATAITLVLGYLALGGWVSLKAPFTLEEYQLSYGGSLVYLIVIVLLSNLPGILWMSGASPLLLGVLFTIYFTCYYLVVRHSARRFEEARGRIAAAVAR